MRHLHIDVLVDGFETLALEKGQLFVELRLVVVCKRREYIAGVVPRLSGVLHESVHVVLVRPGRNLTQT
jgi:hypothetical protein